MISVGFIFFALLSAVLDVGSGVVFEPRQVSAIIMIADTGRVKPRQFEPIFYDPIPNIFPEKRVSTDYRVFEQYELPPTFPGGYSELDSFIKKHIKMPDEAVKAGISGRVFVSLTIEVTGIITHVNVLKGLGFGCDEEAIRLVKSMPNWKPGSSNGRLLPIKLLLPIPFIRKD